jgi:predicted permease
VSVGSKPGGYQNLDLPRYRRQLLDRLSSLPGVLSASFSDFEGPGQRGWREAVSTMADALNPQAGVITTGLSVSPGFLQTLGIRLSRGRDFDWRDDERHPRVAIVSSSLAARLFPSHDAIGKRIRFGFMPEFHDLEIVGIASTARLFDLRDRVAPVIYLPYSQHPKWAERGDLFLRTRTAPEVIAQQAGREIESFGYEYAKGARTMGQAVSQALTTDRLVALLSSFFAILALLLASLGLYGLASYAVTHRTREIGIRSALGAGPAVVRWAVLRETLTLVVAGTGLGIPLALGASRLIASMLFGVSARDLPTIAFISLLLLAVALSAGYLPARRASRIDPAIALRSE